MLTKTGTLCALVMVAGCRFADGDSLGIAEVFPGSGPVGEDVPVDIRGHGFQIVPDPAYDVETSQLAPRFEARLNGIPLEEVRWINEKQLSAIVPATTPAGRYDLVVVCPGGRSTHLHGAFSVLSATADGGSGGQSGDHDGDGGGDDEGDSGGNTEVLTLRIVGADKDVLTANGIDQTGLMVRLQDAAGLGVAGETVSFTSPDGGSFTAVVDLGDGRYSVLFTAPDNAGDGLIVITASVQQSHQSLSDSKEIQLVQACDGADYTVGTWSDLATAVGQANAAGQHVEICVEGDTVIQTGVPLTINNSYGVFLRGEARSVLDGQLLDPGEGGFSLASDGNGIANLTFENFPVVAVRISGNRGTVIRSRFVACARAIVVEAAESTIGPNVEIQDSSVAGIDIAGEDTFVVGSFLHDQSGAPAIRIVSAQNAVIKFNRFARNAVAIEVLGGDGLSVMNNTFWGQTSGALELDANVEESRVHNNVFAMTGSNALAAPSAAFSVAPTHNVFFANAGDCSPCVLGADNLLADPLLTAPFQDDFHPSLDPPSPCIDAGRVVGDSFLGFAPDIGAYEVR